jgi:hypothetical protein
MRGISWVSEDLLASQEGLCSMELDISCFSKKKFLKLAQRFAVSTPTSGKVDLLYYVCEFGLI